MKKLYLLICFLLLTCCSFAQNGPMTINGTIMTLTRSLDVSQQMQGCPGNNYNAEGQCNGSLQWYYHTGYISLTATSKLTGKVFSGSAYGTGQKLSFTVVIDLSTLPADDILTFGETETVFCPIVNQYVVDSLSNWVNELAFTRESVLGTQPAGAFKEYLLTPYCSHTIPPDYFAVSTLGPKTSNYVAWDFTADCISPTGAQPWACQQISATPYSTLPGPGNCTQN